MADLIAIGYKDETTAEAAADEARRLAKDLTIEPDAIAVIVRDAEGKFHVHTSHHSVEDGTTWGMLWGLLFGALFFVPFLGVAVGAGLGAIMGRITRAGVDNDFQEQARDLLQPGTSALFLMVDKATPDRVVDALSHYGGTVLKSSLSEEGEKELKDALRGH
ncbi:MAG TPA: DUF1269 domain-containing protein [Streptosporangiaceae bacterium]|nr:DUF1269 domain-containing protein [Streptosporangiaceae bacterium]